jgi:hypothetical protein
MFDFVTHLFVRVFGARRMPANRPAFPRPTLVVLQRHYMANACRHQERKHDRALAQTLTSG